METKVSTIMTPIVVSAEMQDTVEKVEHILYSNKLSAVPVIDSGGDPPKNECFGIINPAELALFHEMKRNPKAVRAWEICLHKPVEISPDLTVRDAAQIMVLQGIHHLVVTEHKSVKGFVSSLDLLKEFFLKGAHETRG